MRTSGFIWVFANSKRPHQSVIVADTMVSPDLDAIESVDKAEGWICVFSALVANVPSNLQALARELKLPQLDHTVELSPVVVVNALHKVVHGEMQR